MMEKMKKHTHREVHQSTKSMLVILGVIFFSVFLMGTVSAFEFDNVKNYDKATKTITIKNSIFGIPFLELDTVAKIRLDSPVIVYVTEGSNKKVAEFTISNYENYSNVFKEMEFYDIKNNMQKFNRDFIYKYKNDLGTKTVYRIVEDYNSSKLINKSFQEENIKWINLNTTKSFPKGNLTIGIFIDVYKEDKVEWIPTLFGVRIDEWAEFDFISSFDISSEIPSSVKGLTINDTTVWVLDSATATAYEYFPNGTYKGISWLTNDTAPYGITTNNSFIWINDANGDEVYKYFMNGTYTGNSWDTAASSNICPGDMTTNTTDFWITDYCDNDVYRYNVSGGFVGTWTPVAGLEHWGITTNNSFIWLSNSGESKVYQYFMNGTSTGNNWSLTANNNVSRGMGFNGTVFMIADDGNAKAVYVYEGSPTGPTIVLNSPIDAFNSTSQIIDFNGTVTSSTLINETLFIDNILNETNSSGIEGDYLFTKTIADGSHNWTYEACDDIGCTTATTRTFTVDTSPTITVVSPINNTNFTTSIIYFNATSSLAVDKWIVNYNGTNVTLSDINTSLTVEDGNNFNLLLYANNSLTGVFGLNDSIFFTVDTTFPNVSVTSPTGNQGTFASGRNLTLNWNVSDTNLDTCFYEYNGINTTVTCSLNTTNLTVTDSTNTSLIFWANDTFGQESFDTTNWSYSFIENSVTFTENVSETSSQFFEINLSTSLSVLSITAQLNYNGTDFISDVSCNGNCIVNNTIDVSLVLSGESELKDFFWKINIFNGTDSISVNTSTQQQNVTRIHIERCDATFTTQSLNFTTYDERNLSRITPYDFDGTFDIWTGSGVVKRNNNFTNSSITEQTLCITPNATYFTYAQIDYIDVSNSTLYTKRNYFFQNDTISNVSQDIFLYLLDSSFSTSFILKVQDNNLLPLEDYLIETQRFYPGENLFRIVQIAKTSENGKTVGFFETETVDYRFIISLNNLNLLTTSQQKIVGEEAPFTLTFTIGEDLGKPWQDLENLTDLQYSLVYNKSTNVVTYTYVDTSGDFTLGTLIVEEQNFSFSTNTVLCNTNSSQSSATLTCNMSGDTTGTFNARGFITRQDVETLISQINFLIQDFIDTVGNLGLLLAWFLILISTFVFKFNEIAGIFMVNATVIFVNIIGLVSFGMLSISALIAVSIIIVTVMQK